MSREKKEDGLNEFDLGLDLLDKLACVIPEGTSLSTVFMAADFLYAYSIALSGFSVEENKDFLDNMPNRVRDYVGYFLLKLSEGKGNSLPRA